MGFSISLADLYRNFRAAALGSAFRSLTATKMANPKTFVSDFERGYQAALNDIIAWTERASLIDSVALNDEIRILRKRTRMTTGPTFKAGSSELIGEK